MDFIQTYMDCIKGIILAVVGAFAKYFFDSLLKKKEKDEKADEIADRIFSRFSDFQLEMVKYTTRKTGDASINEHLILLSQKAGALFSDAKKLCRKILDGIISINALGEHKSMIRSLTEGGLIEKWYDTLNDIIEKSDGKSVKRRMEFKREEYLVVFEVYEKYIKTDQLGKKTLD